MKPDGEPVFGRAAVPLLGAATAAAQDRAAREAGGVPERLLMENAARSAALVLARLYPDGRVAVLAGSGNNGGDALVLARTLRAWGRDAAVIVASRPPADALRHGHEVPLLADSDAHNALAGAAVIVDGLLGTGSSGAPRGAVLEWIRIANAAGPPILSLDLPSGVDSTTGAVPGDAIRATATVTFGSPKTGLMFQPARAHCGRLIAVEIGFPPFAGDIEAELITPLWAARQLPHRGAAAHKNTAGRVLIAAGSMKMGGAAVLAALGAFRAGAGLVRVLSARSNRTPILRRVPEAIVGDAADAGDVAALASGAQSLVMGPGIGTDERAMAVMARILDATRGVPAVFDADALNHFATDKAALKAIASERCVVLTPHPGEMARLSGMTTMDVTADPMATARDFAQDAGCVVLLKGAPSIVAAPGEPTLVNTVGSSDLAKAGMGDLLAGCVGAFLAHGATPRAAAALALYYTGLAADHLRKGRSLMPTDVANALHSAFAAAPLEHSTLALPFITFDQPSRW